jgi:energy-converting hydrogenase Eha subunit C
MRATQGYAMTWKMAGLIAACAVLDVVVRSALSVSWSDTLPTAVLNALFDAGTTALLLVALDRIKKGPR